MDRLTLHQRCLSLVNFHWNVILPMYSSHRALRSFSAAVTNTRSDYIPLAATTLQSVTAAVVVPVH